MHPHTCVVLLCVALCYVISDLPLLILTPRRPPIFRWAKGRVALLGDSAHAMQPNLGQGGCMAIEDAFQLGRDVAAALSKVRRSEAQLWCAWLHPLLQPGGWLSQLARDVVAALSKLRCVAAVVCCCSRVPRLWWGVEATALQERGGGKMRMRACVQSGTV